MKDTAEPLAAQFWGSAFEGKSFSDRLGARLFSGKRRRTTDPHETAEGLSAAGGLAPLFGPVGLLIGVVLSALAVIVGGRWLRRRHGRKPDDPYEWLPPS
jgi:hypothetical protein